MSLASSYQLRHSLPNRSASQRPRSLSLSEYQPLNFDRDALEAAYQQVLFQPTTGSSSSLSNPSFASHSGGSAETHETGGTSMLSHQLKAGDNPHSPLQPAEENRAGNFAGVGAGHALTPPSSPLHKSAQNAHRVSLLSPVPDAEVLPLLPPRPSALPESTFRPALSAGMRRKTSYMDVDDDASGYMTDPTSGSHRGKGKRRMLPPVPTNVPAPEPPAWEPDYKAHIPQELTAPSAAHAYASLAAPPPGLPPRRVQPSRSASRPSTVRHSTGSMGLGRAGRPEELDGDVNMGGQSAAGPSRSRPIMSSSSMTGFNAAGPSGTGRGTPEASNSSIPAYQPPPGAPGLPPMTGEPSTTSAAARKSRPAAETNVNLYADAATPIWSTHYIDPSKRDTMSNIPYQVTNVANIALSGLSTGPQSRNNPSSGAPIDAMARIAKEWFIRPDATFMSDTGGIEVGLAVVDGGTGDWGSDKGRKRARVEVTSKQGGIKVDLLEVDANRQIDLKIDTKTGDVLVLLPDHFHGPIHITSQLNGPVFLPTLLPQLQPVHNPYASFYTTFAAPLRLQDEPEKPIPIEYQTINRLQKHLPKSFREKSDLLDQIVGGFASHTRGEQSKITISTNKGRVVLGYRETADERTAGDMNLSVGHQSGNKRTRWWRR